MNVCSFVKGPPTCQAEWDSRRAVEVIKHRIRWSSMTKRLNRTTTLLFCNSDTSIVISRMIASERLSRHVSLRASVWNFIPMHLSIPVGLYRWMKKQINALKYRYSNTWVNTRTFDDTVDDRLGRQDPLSKCSSSARRCIKKSGSMMWTTYATGDAPIDRTSRPCLGRVYHESSEFTIISTKSMIEPEWTQ